MTAAPASANTGAAGAGAQLFVIDPIADASSGTFLVRLELPNPDREIMGGVKCTAHFPTPARYGADPPDQPDDEPAKGGKPPVAPLNDARQQSVSVETERAPIAETEPYDHAVQSTNSGYIVLTPKLVSQAERRELVADLPGKSRELADFIGVPWEEAMLRFYEQDRLVHTASKWQVRQKLYTTSVGRWKPYEKYLKPLFDALGPID